MFSELNSMQLCKDLYRKLALRLHPDQGGSNELMISLQKAYDKQVMFLCELQKVFSEKDQEKIYENVYEKIYLNDERLFLFEEIQNYANKHAKYDCKFFYSVKEFLVEKGYVTPNQYNALVKVYYAFEMHVKNEKD